jgi:hypothetical protein
MSQKLHEIPQTAFEEWLSNVCPVFERPGNDYVYVMPLSHHVGVKVALKMLTKPTGTEGNSVPVPAGVFKSACILGVARRTDGKLLRVSPDITSCGSWAWPTAKWAQEWQRHAMAWIHRYFADAEVYEKLAQATGSGLPQAEARSPHYPWPPRSESEKRQLLETVTKLADSAKRVRDNWTLKFAGTLGECLTQRRSLSERQEFMLVEKLAKHGVVLERVPLLNP